VYTQTRGREVIRIKQAFESVVAENTAWLYRYVRQRLRNPTIAEDLTQEIWIKAFRAYDSANKVMLELFNEQDTVYIIHPVVLFY